MTERYVKTLRLFDFGKRVKAMFGFVPIEQLDEQEESFFDMEQFEDIPSGEGKSGAESEKAEIGALTAKRLDDKESAPLSENGFGGNGDKPLFEERKPKNGGETPTKPPVPKGREKELAKSGFSERGNILFSTETVGGREPVTERLFDFDGYSNENVGEWTGESRFPTERSFAAGEGERKWYSSGETPESKESFDEKIWLAKEREIPTEGGGESFSEQRRISNRLMPALSRIERLAERIEQTVNRETILEREQTPNEGELFRERLESVLRGEIIRNGFEL